MTSTQVKHQIKSSEVPKYRKMYAIQQKYLCPICRASIATGMTALDHNHSNGQLRSTLCGTCNRNEGKVLKAMVYMAKKTHMTWTDCIQWLRNLADYIEYHRDNPSGIVHPTFDLNTGKQKPKKRPKRK